MAEPYEGQISTLECEIVGNNHEQQLRKLANYILYAGKRAERRGIINTEHNAFKKMVNEISEDRYSEEYAQLEDIIFGQIETYIEEGSNGVYTFECNDICLGTIKYFEELFAHCSKLSNSDQDRFKILKENMYKIASLTATMSEATKKATPEDLKNFKEEKKSKLKHKNKKTNEETFEEEKGV